MKSKPNNKQETRLKHQADQAILSPLPLRPGSRQRKSTLEIVTRLILGVPLGIMLYYGVVTLYIGVLECLAFGTLALAAVFHFSALSVNAFIQSANFGPVSDPLMAAFAVIASIYFVRRTTRLDNSGLAWIILPLMLPVTLILFYLTAIYHKPLLPFYGQ